MKTININNPFAKCLQNTPLSTFTTNRRLHQVFVFRHLYGADKRTRTAEPLPYQGSALPPELYQHICFVTRIVYIIIAKK